MPLYDYQCEDCQQVEERYAGMDQPELECRQCGGKAHRVFSTRYWVHGEPDYVTDNISGKPVRVTSRRQLRDLLKQHGLMERFGKGWR